MSRYRQAHPKIAGDDSLARAIEMVEFELAIKLLHEEIFVELMKHPQSFAKKLKLLNRNRLLSKYPLPPDTGDVIEGVYERKPSGHYDVALQTDRGRLVLLNAECVNERAADPQMISFAEISSHDLEATHAPPTPGELLRQLSDAGANSSAKLLFAVELTRFEPAQEETLLPMLWQYILAHRNSNSRDELVGAGAAIRKYIALMPMDRIGELAVLLESGHRSPLPIDLELEVVKMIYRNFEVLPPIANDTQRDLAQRLYEIVQAYINPRILLRDKHSAVASLAIEAIVAMRSSLAVEALQAAAQCHHRWFMELVNDDLNDLHEKWMRKEPDAAAWLSNTRTQVVSPVQSKGK